MQPHQSAAVRIALEGGWLQVLADGTPKTAQDISSATGAEVQLIGLCSWGNIDINADHPEKFVS